MSGAVYSKVLGCEVWDDGSLRDALAVSSRLMSAFQWDSSKQGGDFWADQYHGLTPEGRRIIERALAEIEAGATFHKYKVGDKVESVPVPEAGVGIVTEVLGDDTYKVRYNNRCGVCTDHAQDIRPHEPTLADRIREGIAAASKPRRAIVARMQNGRPAPSHSPHVHATTKSARNEAERLAKLNVGAEFAVLEIVCVSKATAEVTTEAA